MDKLYPMLSKPGVRRDGTALDNDWFSDGVWVRWQRGRVRKIGGYKAMSQAVRGPVRSILVDSRNGINSAHYFSQYGIQRQQFALTGTAGSVDDRTPLGFYTGQGNPLLTWSHSVMTSSTGGSFSALLACGTPDLNDLTSDVGGNLFTGNVATGDPLTVVSDASGPILVSGGVTVLQPFCVVYGSNGLIRNSNANDFSNSGTAGLGWTVGGSGFANSANVAGTKFVYGAPVRGGSYSPAGLFWSLDSLVRMSFVGGSSPQTIWQYDTLSSPTSIMGKKTIVEHDGKFFWIGTDRFLFYNGVVQELPNQMNCNWFFDNLNYDMRNKVWGTKIPRWGEIWWFYPRGTATECTDAIIFNYNENTWYDATKMRSAGSLAQIFPHPIWAGAEDSTNTTVLTVGFSLNTSAPTASGAVLTFAATTGLVNGQLVQGTNIPPGTTVNSFTGTTVTMSASVLATVPTGQSILFSSMVTPLMPGMTATGGSSGATGQVVASTQQYVNLTNVIGTFTSSETVTGSGSALAKSMAATFAQEFDTVYQHESGVDKIIGSNVTAIQSSFTTTQFGFAVGNPFMQNEDPKPNVMTRIGRFEMDFNQSGPLNVYIYGASFAEQTEAVMEMQVVQPTDYYVEFRQQERQMSIKVESNIIGGFFEQGEVMMRLDPGDVRSTKAQITVPGPSFTAPPAPLITYPWTIGPFVPLVPVRDTGWPYVQTMVPPQRSPWFIPIVPLLSTYVKPADRGFPYVETMVPRTTATAWLPTVVPPQLGLPVRVHMQTPWPYPLTQPKTLNTTGPIILPRIATTPVRVPVLQPWPYVPVAQPRKATSIPVPAQIQIPQLPVRVSGERVWPYALAAQPKNKSGIYPTGLPPAPTLNAALANYRAGGPFGKRVIFHGDSTTTAPAPPWAAIDSKFNAVYNTPGGIADSLAFTNAGEIGVTFANVMNGSSVFNINWLTAQGFDLVVCCLGINDVRDGSTSAAQISTMLTNYVAAVHAANPNACIILWTPNSFLSNDPTSSNYITPNISFAQQYTDVLWNGYNNVVGTWPTYVAHVDKQQIYGRTCAPGPTTLMQDTLHPDTNTGYEPSFPPLADVMRPTGWPFTSLYSTDPFLAQVMLGINGDTLNDYRGRHVLTQAPVSGVVASGQGLIFSGGAALKILDVLSDFVAGTGASAKLTIDMQITPDIARSAPNGEQMFLNNGNLNLGFNADAANTMNASGFGTTLLTSDAITKGSRTDWTIAIGGGICSTYRNGTRTNKQFVTVDLSTGAGTVWIGQENSGWTTVVFYGTLRLRYTLENRPNHAPTIATHPGVWPTI